MDIGIALTVCTFIVAISGLLYTVISSRNSAAVGTVNVLEVRIKTLERENENILVQLSRCHSENETYKGEVLALTRQLLRGAVLGDANVGGKLAP